MDGKTLKSPIKTAGKRIDCIAPAGATGENGD